MSVISVKETAASGSQRQNEKNLEIRHEFTREFIVRTSNEADDERVVEKAKGIPKIGEGMGNGTSAVCVEVNPARDPENIKTWRVAAIYRYYEADENKSGQTDKAVQEKVDEPPSIRSGCAYEEAPLYADRDGNPVVNSAGDPFAERPTGRRKIPWVEITRFEPDGGAIIAPRWDDTVNGDPFWSCEPGQIKIEEIRAERLAKQLKEGWLYYWRVTYMFQFRKEGWSKWIADMGMRELCTYYATPTAQGIPDGTVRPILEDTTGLPVTSPVRLDGRGHKLTPPDARTVLLEFNYHPQAFFSWLRLPQLRVLL